MPGLIIFGIMNVLRPLKCGILGVFSMKTYQARNTKYNFQHSMPLELLRSAMASCELGVSGSTTVILETSAT
eukprot:354829-Hanusia_phi.AAC.1